jgi:hypothetical protein
MGAIDLRTVLCTSCGAQMIFLMTKTGKRMPVDADTVSPEDTEFDHTRHKSHFATCTNPAKHRKPRP